MIKDEELDTLLADLQTPELPAEVAARVRTLARAEFVPEAESRTAIPLRLVLSGAMVPTLLVTAAVVRAVETVEVAAKIYDGS